MLASPTKTSQKPSGAPSFASWPLLNPLTLRHSGMLNVGLLGVRPLSAVRQDLGYSLAWGESVTTVQGAFAVGGLQETELRFVPRDALSLCLSRYQWEAGPRLGPLEALARVGFTLAHLDVGHGFSFGLFSPRVGLGLWWKVPHARVGMSAFTEYFWRWVGDQSAFVHGLTLELQPDAQPLLQRSTSSPSARALP